MGGGSAQVPGRRVGRDCKSRADLYQRTFKPAGERREPLFDDALRQLFQRLGTGSRPPGSGSSSAGGRSACPMPSCSRQHARMPSRRRRRACLRVSPRAGWRRFGRAWGRFFAGLGGFGLAVLAVLGFGLGVEIALAAFMLLFPLALVGIATLALARDVAAGDLTGEALWRRLGRRRMWNPDDRGALDAGGRDRGHSALRGDARDVTAASLVSDGGLGYVARMSDKRPLTPGRLTVGGCPEGFDAKFLADTLARAGGQVMHVARDDARLAAMRSALGFSRRRFRCSRFRPGTACPTTASRPTRRSPRRGWRRWPRSRGGFDRPAVVLTTVNAATQRVPPRALLREASFTATVGQRVDMNALRGYLARMGFRSTDRDRARRVRDPRRSHRHLSAGRGRSGAARSVRRPARQRAAVRPREPADDRNRGPGRTRRRSPR